MMRNMVRLLKVAVGVLASGLICYGVARAYLAHEITMAGQMLKDLGTLKIGDSEDLADSISREYGGYRREQEILRQLYEKPDYQYVVQVDPWRFWHRKPDMHPSRLGTTIETASTELAPGLRKSIALRRWSVLGIVSIRQKRVVAVTATAIVEGRNEWLGGIWHLFDAIPDYAIEQFIVQPGNPRPQTNSYLAGWTQLKFSKTDGVGESAEFWITPSATQQEMNSASKFILQCLVSRTGCQTVCEFVPGAEEYTRFTDPKGERPNVCSAPRPNGYW